jgi:hypothetical protein
MGQSERPNPRRSSRISRNALASLPRKSLRSGTSQTASRFENSLVRRPGRRALCRRPGRRCAARHRLRIPNGRMRHRAIVTSCRAWPKVGIFGRHSRTLGHRSVLATRDQSVVQLLYDRELPLVDREHSATLGLVVSREYVPPPRPSSNTWPRLHRRVVTPKPFP